MENGGWCRIENWQGLPGPLYVRFQGIDGLPRVTELYLDGRSNPISSGDLKRINIAALEEAMGGDVIRNPRIDVPGPDLSTLASYYATTWNRKIKHWVAQAFFAQIENSGVESVPPKRSRLTERPAPSLKAPENGLTDGFLSDVGRVYKSAVSRHESPIAALVEQSGAPKRTVERWVYQARKRGLMDPATRRGRII